MVKLSQCMIVKNEKENIGKALSWAKDIAYEQIVVDTGSTDGTAELAKAMGARVYHFDWIDDFSAAKNYAISKATGDWIAFLDADEYFNEEDTKKLMGYLEELKDSKYVTIFTSLVNLDDNGQIFESGVQNRIFRNIPTLRYHRPIHEVLILEGIGIGHFSIDIRDDLTIFHTGYANSVNQSKNKTERNLRILLKELEKDPENREIMGYLGDAYLANDDDENARKWYEKAIDALDTPVDTYDMRTSASFIKLMRILYKQKKFEQFLAVYEQAVGVVPKESDFDYFMSIYWIQTKKDWEKGVFYLEKALQKLEKNKQSFFGENLLKELQSALELRVVCYYHLQNWTKCIENCVALLKKDIYNFKMVKMLLEIFYIDEAKGGANANVVLQFLSQLYSLQSLKDRMYLLRAAMEVHYDSMVLELRNLFTAEELKVLDNSIGK